MFVFYDSAEAVTDDPRRVSLRSQFRATFVMTMSKNQQR